MAASLVCPYGILALNALSVKETTTQVQAAPAVIMDSYMKIAAFLVVPYGMRVPAALNVSAITTQVHAALVASITTT